MMFPLFLEFSEFKLSFHKFILWSKSDQLKTSEYRLAQDFPYCHLSSTALDHRSCHNDFLQDSAPHLSPSTYNLVGPFSHLDSVNPFMVIQSIPQIIKFPAEQLRALKLRMYLYFFFILINTTHKTV